MFDRISQRYENSWVTIFDQGPQLHQCENCKHRYPENLSTWQHPHSMVKGDIHVCSEACALEWLDTNWEIVDEYEAVLNG